MTKQTAKTKPAAEVVEKKDHLPANIGDFEQFAGVGFENTRAEDFAIPFVRILQALSPQCKRSDGAYIPGAVEGMLFNTVSNAVIEASDGAPGVVVVPCGYVFQRIEYNKREDGGGIVAIHDADYIVETARDEKNRDITAAGTEIVDTATFYVLVCEETAPGSGVLTGAYYPAVIGMQKTQRKYAKRWLSNIRQPVALGDGKTFVPPMFMRQYRVTTTPESKGDNSWYSFHVAECGAFKSPKDPLFVAAHEFHKEVNKGTVKVADAAVGDADDDAEGGY